jgi:hypothetical protein
MKPKPEAKARATMRLPQTLWDAVQHRAIDVWTLTKMRDNMANCHVVFSPPARLEG